jgi:hypothetical protein
MEMNIHREPEDVEEIEEEGTNQVNRTPSESQGDEEGDNFPGQRPEKPDPPYPGPGPTNPQQVRSELL